MGKFISGIVILWIVALGAVAGASMMGFPIEVSIRSVTGLWMLVTCWWFMSVVIREVRKDGQ
jgi:hypothetical protein